MPIDYAGTWTWPNNIQIPADADPADGESVRVPLRQLANRTVYLRRDKTYAGIYVDSDIAVGVAVGALSAIGPLLGATVASDDFFRPSLDWNSLRAPRAADYLVEARVTAAGRPGTNYMVSLWTSEVGLTPFAAVLSGDAGLDSVAIGTILSLAEGERVNLQVSPMPSGPVEAHDLIVRAGSILYMRRL